MVFICSFIILFVFAIVFMFLIAGGFIVFSNDKVQPVQNSKPVNHPTQKVTKPTPPVQKAYIDLNGTLIELFTKAEITKAKKDGFKVVLK